MICNRINTCLGTNYQKGWKACRLMPGGGLSNIYTCGKEEGLEQVDPLPLWVDFVNNIQKKALDTSVFVRKSALTGTNSINLSLLKISII